MASGVGERSITERLSPNGNARGVEAWDSQRRSKLIPTSSPI